MKFYLAILLVFVTLILTCSGIFLLDFYADFCDGRREELFDDLREGFCESRLRIEIQNPLRIRNSDSKSKFRIL